MVHRVLICLIAVLAGAAMTCHTALAKALPTSKPKPMIGRYPLTWASLPHKNVPKGQVFSFKLKANTIFPDTRRIITVYVPAEYKARKPAAVMVSLDGWGPSTVCDNLIYKKQMPVVIGIGVSAGVAPPVGVKITTAQYSQMVVWGPIPTTNGVPVDPRWNRSFEFDGVSDRLARFLMQVVLPAVEKHRTPSGLPIILTRNPNERAIMGGSSGGIGAFTAAWMDPDAFRRVNTAVGTFVDMRGGNWYPPIIRKMDPKPLRVFMQSGSHDDWPAGPEMGSWPLGNLALEHALKFAGYAVEHAWGTGGHNGNQETSVLPHALRWLWKDWKHPIKTGWSHNPVLQAMLIPGQHWHLVTKRSFSPGYMAANQKGQVFFQDTVNGNIYRLAHHGDPRLFVHASPGLNGMAFGPNGRLYVADSATHQIVAYAENGSSTVVANGIRGAQLVVTHRRVVYVAGNTSRLRHTGIIWRINPGKKPVVVAHGLRSLSGIILRPDDGWLCAAQAYNHMGYSFQVRSQGNLKYREPYYWFEQAPWAENSGTHQLTVDRNGWIYAATVLGVQVLDHSGRVSAILSVPSGRPVLGVCFGGTHFRYLFATNGKHIYERRLKAQGMPSWHRPISLPVGLGES